MTSYYEQMKNRKTNEGDVDAMLEGVWELTPEDKFEGSVGHNNTPMLRVQQDNITQRLGVVTIDRLMNAAKAKQRFETNRTRENESDDAYYRRTKFLPAAFIERDRRPTLPDELPDISSGENEKMLREVATIVFNSSQVGDTIQTMADKVVVFCAWILFCSGTQSILLSDDEIMSVINTVFKTHNTLYNAYHKIFTRLNSLNIQVSKRPVIKLNRFTTAGREVDGGFTKKNYRRSIKKNSRKLRSRR